MSSLNSVRFLPARDHSLGPTVLSYGWRDTTKAQSPAAHRVEAPVAWSFTSCIVRPPLPRRNGRATNSQPEPKPSCRRSPFTQETAYQCCSSVRRLSASQIQSPNPRLSGA